MAFARSDALAYLSGVLAQWLSDAGLSASDSAGALKEPIDEAYLAVGVAWGDLATATVEGSSVPGFLKVLEWTGLKRVLFAIARRVDLDVDAPKVDKKYSQAVKALTDLVAAAASAASPFVTTATAWGAGGIMLDYLEPEPTS